MFEKDIYQLIRGLRAHKGNEREYIQDSLRECRKEIKTQDMDQKATALLKLVYLEMFGHDMSWASFNVLEVMSSPKYVQKRVGYLAAVQSFRSDTEVLMLAENLLKKDINSPNKLTIALPLITIPHVINPSMANSLLGDLLQRLSHSDPSIRKKTIVTLYRLALVYPETLRPAWPKIKERLQDEHEDPSVTSAIVNVICELGWRRPQDFLPLAPRLFELLTSGNNNWMAIKIIKLFSVLTPLEPRLIKKLLPPLTALIKTTPAMSLLYECINGIMQGGIMEAAEGTIEGDEIARLCVDKLRAMLVVKGDPNLRYVALLAFAKITQSHAHMVSQHQDVILECIDDPDISIRTRALDLVIGMVNADTLQTVVERLLRQLRTAGSNPVASQPEHDRVIQDGILPMAADDDGSQEDIRPKEPGSTQAPPLPDDYRTSVIERILAMCSKDTYKNMVDFDWYIGVLVELVQQCPSAIAAASGKELMPTVADSIGMELLNVAVRVKAVRPEAAAAAQTLLTTSDRQRAESTIGAGKHNVLGSAAFIAGEYATMLPDPNAVLASLVRATDTHLPAKVLTSYLQAIVKVLIAITGHMQSPWSSYHQSNTALLIARIVHFLEPLTLHPDLEVQERAVETLDLMRLTAEALSNSQVGNEDAASEPPLLLTQAIPSLFTGIELGPVAPSAVRNVPPPDGLDLDAPINSNLNAILQRAEYESSYAAADSETYRNYYQKPSAASSTQQRPAADMLENTGASRSSSYQDAEQVAGDESVDGKNARRSEHHKDDPYYIDSSQPSGVSTPLHSILRSSNGETLDVDAIPVMELNLDSRDLEPSSTSKVPPVHTARKPKRNFEVAKDETLGDDDATTIIASNLPVQGPARAKKTLLEVDSSGLSSLSLSEAGLGSAATRLEVERRAAEEEEMAKAIKEVERLRLEMQRAQERITPLNAPVEGFVARRKKKSKVRTELHGEDRDEQANGDDTAVVKKKKKKKKKVRDVEPSEAEAPLETTPEETSVIKTKRKKTRQVVFDDDNAIAAG